MRINNPEDTIMKYWRLISCLLIMLTLAFSNVCQTYAGDTAEIPTVDIVIPESDWPDKKEATSEKLLLVENEHADQGLTEGYARLVLPEIAYIRLEVEMPFYQNAEISWDLLKEDKKTVIASHDFKMSGGEYTLDLFRGTLPAGTYYLHLHDIYMVCPNFNGWYLSFFTARYRAFDFEEDDLAGANNDKESAQLLDGKKYGYLSISGDDPRDWYTFEVGEEGASLSIVGPEEFGCVNFDLMREDGEYLAKDEFVHEYASYTLTEGKYYICMISKEVSGTSVTPPIRGGYYSLNLRQNKPQSPDPGVDPGTTPGDDPGDDPGTGTTPGSHDTPGSGTQQDTDSSVPQDKPVSQAKPAAGSGSSKVAVGTVRKVSGQKYIVTGKDKAAFSKAKNTGSVKVPDTVKIAGKKYKVTRIDANAFKGSKIRTVTIGKNVTAIKKNAFKSSPAKKLILKTGKLKKSTVKGCLKGSKIKTIQVKVNKKTKKAYRKIFVKKIVGKKVTVR